VSLDQPEEVKAAERLAVYRQIDYPQYIPGLWTTMALNMGSIAVLAVLSTIFKKQNRRANAGEIEIEGAQGFLYTI
jgi:hypothetical protein